MTITFTDREPRAEDFGAAVLWGLTQPQKRLPPKFFYDARGSSLFEAICETPEYYPTRTETALLKCYAAEIAATVGTGCVVIEPGSGGSQKVRLLLRELCPALYLPLDISGRHLLHAAQKLAAEHPRLAIHAVCMDYSQGWAKLDGLPLEGKRVVFFPGSTIGNFEPLEALEFLRDTARLVGQGGGLLIGVDLKKDPERLHRAYNDAQGITRDFNLNLLRRINNELGADFDLHRFRHYAFYHARKGRIEMHLLSQGAQTVRLLGHSLTFAEGETIHTENSYKYTVEEFQALAGKAGFQPVAVWRDAENLVSVQYFEVA